MDNYNGAQQRYQYGDQTVPVAWITEVNHKLATLEKRLKALTAHLEVEFKDRPSIPAYVAVVSTKAAPYSGGRND